MTILETARMILRRFHTEDLNVLCELHYNPEAMKFLVGGVRLNREAVKRDLEAYLEMDQKDGLSKWAMIEKSSGRFMGRAGLIHIHETKEIDLGYAFHPDFWNRGFATEIAHALMNLAHNRGLAQKIVGLVRPENQASAKVLQKIGLRFNGEGTYFGVCGFHVYRP